MMQKNTILHFFKVECEVACPACNVKIAKSKLNEHLDNFCNSSVVLVNEKSDIKSDNFPARSISRAQGKILTSNRLSLKGRRKNILKGRPKKPNVIGEDDEIMIIDEIVPSTSGSTNRKKSENILNAKNNSSKSLPTPAEKINTLENETVKNKINNSLNNNAPSLNSILNTNNDGTNNDTKELKSLKMKIDDSNQFIDKTSEIERAMCDEKFMEDAIKCIETDVVFSELSDPELDSEKKPSVNYTPYYISNFKHILKTVLNEDDNKVLFDEEDRKFISAFESASGPAQKLYVRLFQRKYKWLRMSKINYPEISNDLHDILEELAIVDLVDSDSSNIDFETTLNLVSLPEARTLAKHFNFSSGKNKADIIEMLQKHCKQHKTVFFASGSNGIQSAILKKVQQLIGKCYRISLLPKRLFTRVLMLFSLPTISEDDDDAAGGQQQQLLTLLQVNKGELIFPTYERTKQTVIFSDRNELIRYELAKQLENDIFAAVESKNFILAKELYKNASDEFDAQCTCEFAQRAYDLPSFLKRYTSFHVYVRCMTQGVEILQRLRDYKEAVSLLQRLLKQKVFCLDYHGRWYDRLALNLEQHLKKPEKALKVINEAIQDENVRVGHRYSLLTRALRILKSYDDDDELKKKVLQEAAVIEAPKVTIQGRLCPRSILGRRHVFVSSSTTSLDEDDVTVLGVEQLAIEHYKEHGYTDGVHGEGSTFISLYCLFFWDIIYDGRIPDVFISPYQTHPLDLNSDRFFKSRQDQILSHLQTLRASTNEELKTIVRAIWNEHHGKSSLVSWDRFSSIEAVEGLVSCLGSGILSGICERLARDFRFTRSGVPDLVVWNPETLLVKIVEVKGPGDKLSSKQVLWLDYLIKIGADAEVCLVEAVASKRLRK